MSTMSSGSPQGNAEVDEPERVTEPEQAQQSAGASHRAAGSGPVAVRGNFGANEWLVEELYQRYLADPASVDRAWWSFFADYQPALPNGTWPQPVITRQRAPQAPTWQAAPPQAPAPAAP